VLPRVTRSGLPTAPWEIQDEVELYAREWGRTAKLHYVPVLTVRGRIVVGCWVVRMSLKPNDKRMQLYQQGIAPEPPTEDVWLHERNPHVGRPIRGTTLREPDYRALDIVQMGAGGVRRFLEQGNTWSGRGESRSIEDHLRKIRHLNQESKEKFREEQKTANRLEQRDKRRWRFKIPFLNIPLEFGPKRKRQGTALPTESGPQTGATTKEKS
jgi:hypothetical protein